MSLYMKITTRFSPIDITFHVEYYKREGKLTLSASLSWGLTFTYYNILMRCTSILGVQYLPPHLLPRPSFCNVVRVCLHNPELRVAHTHRISFLWNKSPNKSRHWKPASLVAIQGKKKTTYHVLSKKFTIPNFSAPLRLNCLNCL